MLLMEEQLWILLMTIVENCSCIRGFIPHESDFDNLTQDILELRLDNGVIIDVGWYPDHDPEGQYCTHVFRDKWENQLWGPVMSLRKEDVEDLVQWLITIFKGN